MLANLLNRWGISIYKISLWIWSFKSFFIIVIFIFELLFYVYWIKSSWKLIFISKIVLCGIDIRILQIYITFDLIQSIITQVVSTCYNFSFFSRADVTRLLHLNRAYVTWFTHFHKKIEKFAPLSKKNEKNAPLLLAE